MMNTNEALQVMATKAKEASWSLQCTTKDVRNAALRSICVGLVHAKQKVFSANKADMDNAIANALGGPLLKRLDICGADERKYSELVQGVSNVVALEDPLGKVSLAVELSKGLELFRVACPVGVICVIFEARPEVVVQIASLCLKSGNAVILKVRFVILIEEMRASLMPSKREVKKLAALVAIFRESLAKHAQLLPVDFLQLVESREDIAELLKMDDCIDLVIPRGSKALVTYVQEHTRIPVLGHADGICALYVHNDCDIEMAIAVILDSKTDYCAACNALETLLIHRNVLATALPRINNALQKAGVAVRADAQCLPFMTGATLATESDFATEFLDLIIAVKCVDSLETAVHHINSHGSHHTDVIITQSKENAETFMSLVDSAGVYHNASTRFADGFRYGFGAEIGVSTNKTHARGPVGLEGLLIYKYKLYGSGDTAAPYGSTKRFTHRNMLSNK